MPCIYKWLRDDVLSVIQETDHYDIVGFTYGPCFPCHIARVCGENKGKNMSILLAKYNTYIYM